MTDLEGFGPRLRQLRREKSAREARDVDQSEVAEAVGSTQVNVARWEAGRIPKDDATLRALAAFYGVSLGWLRYGEEPREAGPERYPPIDPEMFPEVETRAAKKRSRRA